MLMLNLIQRIIYKSGATEQAKPTAWVYILYCESVHAISPVPLWCIFKIIDPSLLTRNASQIKKNYVILWNGILLGQTNIIDENKIFPDKIICIFLCAYNNNINVTPLYSVYTVFAFISAHQLDLHTFMVSTSIVRIDLRTLNSFSSS